MKNKYNCLFIIHDVYQDDNLFPLGVGYLAAMLEKQGYSVDVYCMDIFHYTNDQLAQKLKESEYDIIGLGFVAARFKETIIELCKVINKYKKNAWFVLGGHAPSATPDYMLKKVEADIAVIGEAEETIIELMDCKVNNKDISNIDGIAYCYENTIVMNQRRKPIRNLDELPFPAWHLFPFEKYANSYIFPGMNQNDRISAIESLRGCKNRCTFCYRLEKGIRTRSLESVIEEIKLLHKNYGVTTFYFTDEMFIISKNRVLKFEQLLDENNLKIKFMIDARVDVFDEEIARSLKRSGCIFVNVGCESSSQDVLNEINKNATVEQNINTLETLQKVGIPSGLNFLWGFCNDTKDSLFENVRLIKKYNQFSQLRTIRPPTPYPGCDLFYHAIDSGLLKDTDAFYDKFLNSDIITVNFTSFPDDLCYEWLLKANSELIHFHCDKTNNDSAKELINAFKTLYEQKNIVFRGARHYVKNV